MISNAAAKKKSWLGAIMLEGAQAIDLLGGVWSRELAMDGLHIYEPRHTPMGRAASDVLTVLLRDTRGDQFSNNLIRLLTVLTCSRWDSTRSH